MAIPYGIQAGSRPRQSLIPTNADTVSDTAVSLYSKNGIQANILSFVPMNDNCEISQLKIKNTSAQEKKISVFLLYRVVSVERR